VHASGARHLADPTKLLQGVRRAHGEKFETFGEMLPVPENQIRTIDTGDIIELGDTHLEVFYTPGHAKHHVIFFDPATEAVFSGDALGSKYKNRPNFVLAPPSDYDKEAAKISIDLIKALAPQKIYFTHCGMNFLSDHPHFYEELKRSHERWTECMFTLVSQNQNMDDDMLFGAFLEQLPELKQFPDQFFSFRLSVKGIRTYLRKLERKTGL
jgi:glyoxylase-like metal-dependent hydrolase (beta-lactamase superfamily II)